MSIIRLSPDYFQTLELQANPRRTFTSSSSGVTGSVPLFPDASPSLKEIEHTYVASYAAGQKVDGVFQPPSIQYKDLEEDRQLLVDIISDPNAFPEYSAGAGYGQNVYGGLLAYMAMVNSLPASVPMSKKQEVIRFTPGVKFDKDFLRKRAVKEILFPYYRGKFRHAEWNYTNYHCLNFVTGTGFPASSALIYPAGTGTIPGEFTNPYAPDKRFTFDFWIKPKTTINRDDPYTAGTILHMSSCYAVSLVTGSSYGLDGYRDGFRILLQLSASAAIPPRNCLVGKKKVTKSNSSGDAGFLFASSDNSLQRDKWHHVCIRWGGRSYNNGEGTFYIDGKKDAEFTITSSSVMAFTGTGGPAGIMDPNALFLGNYYEGKNTGTSAISRFFNPKAHREEGVIQFNPLLPEVDPVGISLRHPLNAEIHDVKIYNKCRTDSQIISGSSVGPSALTSSKQLPSDLLFYVPPFFVRETRYRNILQTPFYQFSGSSDDPFNVPLSFGVGGLSVNLENFTREFVSKQYPRLFNLTASVIETQSSKELTANDLLYASGSSVKRNLTVLPCDNGKFFPNFNLLISGTFYYWTDNTADPDKQNPSSKFVDALGNRNLSLVTLDNMLTASNLVTKNTTKGLAWIDLPEPDRNSRGTMVSSIMGPTPEDCSIEPGSLLTVVQRQRDTSSNEVVFFDISNIFYGDRINPGTFVLEDMNVTGSNGRLSFKLKDDGLGNLYRADSKPPHAKWASVGNVLYEEGIAVIKTPNLPLFGKDHFRIKFEGEKKIYTLEVMVPADKGLFNSSSNPTYQDLAPSDYLNETATKFTYLTGLQLHDENLNVIARANLAQPIIKRESDRIVFKLRLDF